MTKFDKLIVVNDVHSSNIWAIFITDEVLKLYIFKFSKDEQWANI